MTLRRRQWKVSDFFGDPARALALWLLVLNGMPAWPGLAGAATTERVVADWHTGIAISGFDPVAYFTEVVPKRGRPDYEYNHAGVTWRFRNEGNRAAFAADPRVYSPQFGGYDPIAIGRGVATPGNPQIWLISRQRLYLFYSSEARDVFLARPEDALEIAKERWPQVMRTLVP